MGRGERMIIIKEEQRLVLSFGCKEDEELEYLYKIAKFIQKSSKKRFKHYYKTEDMKNK